MLYFMLYFYQREDKKKFFLTGLTNRDKIMFIFLINENEDIFQLFLNKKMEPFE